MSEYLVVWIIARRRHPHFNPSRALYYIQQYTTVDFVVIYATESRSLQYPWFVNINDYEIYVTMKSM